MGEWKKVKLGDCIKEVVEKTTENNQHQVLSVTKDGIFSQEDFFKKQIASENNIGYKVIRRNNLVFSTMNLWMGSLDVLTNYDIGIVSPAYKIFKFNEELMLPSYGNYFMKSYYMLEQYKNCSEQGASVVRRNLDLKALLNICIDIPTIEKQEKIVKVLEKVDLIIKKYEGLLEEKNQYVKSKFVDMLSKLKNVEYKKLDELVLLQNGINASAEKYGKGTKCISVMDILNNSYIDYELIKGSVEVTNDQKNNYIVTYGDILFVRSSENLKDAGKSNVYVDKKMNAVFGGFAIRGKKNSEYNPYYINMALKLNSVRKQMMKYAAGTQHINIGQESLKKLTVPLCNIEIQNKFENVYKLIDKQKNELEKIIKNYKKLKRGLIQQLLTRKVDVNV